MFGIRDSTRDLKHHGETPYANQGLSSGAEACEAAPGTASREYVAPRLRSRIDLASAPDASASAPPGRRPEITGSPRVDATRDTSGIGGIRPETIE